MKQNHNAYGAKRRLSLLLSAALLAGLTSYSSSGSAMTLIATNLAQLSEIAESAFVIRVDSVETTVSAQGRPCDTITGTIVEPIFGDEKTSQSKSWNQFRLSRGLALPGMPTYKPGKEYLIFLSGKGADTGFQSPVGMGQGLFDVIRHPKAGTVAVRNAFGNRTLSAGLDINTAAGDMVANDKQSRNLAPGPRRAATEKIKMQLRGGPQNSLGAIRDAATFFHARKRNGRSPSADYRTSTPVQLVR